MAATEKRKIVMEVLTNGKTINGNEREMVRQIRERWLESERVSECGTIGLRVRIPMGRAIKVPFFF